MSYPDLDLGALEKLKVLKQQFLANPTFLDDSPYGVAERLLLLELFEVRTDTVVLKEGEAPERGRVGRKRSDGGMSDEQATIVEDEAIALLKELKDLKPPAGGKTDTDTKIQIIKAKTSLIEKVVNIQERFFNVRKVSTFQKVVIDILQDLVQEDDRNEFLKRLEPYL